MLYNDVAKTEPFSVQAPSLPLSSAPVSDIDTSSYTAANPETWWFGPGHRAETLRQVSAWASPEELQK